MRRNHKHKDDVKRIRKNPYKAFGKDLFLRPLKGKDLNRILENTLDKRFVLTCSLWVKTKGTYLNIPIDNTILNSNKAEIYKHIERHCWVFDAKTHAFEYNICDTQGRVYAGVILKEKDEVLDRVVSIKTTIKELHSILPKKYAMLLLGTLNDVILGDITRQTKRYNVDEIPVLIQDKKDILSHKQIKQLEMIYKTFQEPSKYLGKTRTLKGKMRNKLKGSYVIEDTLYKNGKEYELFARGDDKECSKYIW